MQNSDVSTFCCKSRDCLKKVIKNTNYQDFHNDGNITFKKGHMIIGAIKYFKSFLLPRPNTLGWMQLFGY